MKTRNCKIEAHRLTCSNSFFSFWKLFGWGEFVSGMFAHRCGNDRKMHRNHPKNKVTSFLMSQTALLHANTSVFVYLDGKEVWTKILLTERGERGGLELWISHGGWQAIFLRLVISLQQIWVFLKQAFADHCELNQWIRCPEGTASLVFLCLFCASWGGGDPGGRGGLPWTGSGCWGCPEGKCDLW